MAFREAVKRRMREKNIKVADLAKITGYTTRHIYDLLSGGARWNETTMDKVCKALDVKIEVVDLEQTGTDCI